MLPASRTVPLPPQAAGPEGLFATAWACINVDMGGAPLGVEVDSLGDFVA